jgi:hypothetical protein
MARQQKANKSSQPSEDIHQLRQRAHDMGIEGNSKMNEQQLKQALNKVSKGEDPMTAKQEARGWR